MKRRQPSSQTLEKRQLLAADIAGDDLVSAQVVSLHPQQSFEIDARIGDGPHGANDVDLFRVDLKAGQTLSADIDAYHDDSGNWIGDLDSYLRIFDSDGVDVTPAGYFGYNYGYASSPNDYFYNFEDDYVSFTASRSGAYFVGVSSQSNQTYDPLVSGSGSGQAFQAGDYRLQLLTDGAPVPQLAIANVSVDENAGVVELLVTLDPATESAVSVTYATFNGTAASGSDFVASGGNVSFAAGETEKSVSIPILDDANQEALESFTVSLSESQGANVAVADAIVSIVDNDPDTAGDDLFTAERVSLSAGVLFEIDAAIGDGRHGIRDVDLFRLDLDAGQSISADVDAHFDDAGNRISGLDSYLRIFDSNGIDVTPAGYYGYNYGYASSPNDYFYNFEDDYLSFTASQAGAYYIGVSTQSNQAYDPTVGGSGYGHANRVGEYRLQLLSDSSTVDSVAQADLPSLSIADTQISEDAGSVSIVVSLENAAAQPVSVNYTTVDGSAIAGLDYQRTSGTITFDPGEVSKAIAVSVERDSGDHSDKFFSVLLDGSPSLNLAKASAVVTISDIDADSSASSSPGLSLQATELEFVSGERRTLQLSDFGDASAGVSVFETFRINQPPIHGELQWFGETVESGRVFQSWEIEAGLVTYIAPPRESGNVEDLIGISAFDDEQNGLSTEVTISVTKTNILPTLSPTPIEVNLWESGEIDANDLAFFDADGDAFESIRIEAIPDAGALFFNWNPVSVGQVITASQLDAGSLVFENIEGTDTQPAVLTISASDDSGFGDASELLIYTTGSNRRPLIQDAEQSIRHGESLTISADQFAYTDDDDDAITAFRISALPSLGTFLHRGVPIVEMETIAASDFSGGQVTFVADPSNERSYSAYAEFQAFDGQSWSNESSLTINVAEKEHAPTLAPQNLRLDSEQRHVFTLEEFGFSDRNADDVLSSLRIHTSPLFGELQLRGEVLFEGDTVDRSEIEVGDFTYQPLRGIGVDYRDDIFLVGDDGDLESQAAPISIEFVSSKTSGFGIDDVQFNIESHGAGDSSSDSDDTVFLTLNVSGTVFGDVSRVEFDAGLLSSPTVQSWPVINGQFSGNLRLPVYSLGDLRLRWIAAEGYQSPESGDSLGQDAEGGFEDQNDGGSGAALGIEGPWVSYPIDVELPAEIKPLGLEVEYAREQGVGGFDRLSRVNLVGSITGVSPESRVEIEIDTNQDGLIDDRLEIQLSGDDGTFEKRLGPGTDPTVLLGRLAVYEPGETEPFRTDWQFIEAQEGLSEAEESVENVEEGTDSSQQDGLDDEGESSRGDEFLSDNEFPTDDEIIQAGEDVDFDGGSLPRGPNDVSELLQSLAGPGGGEFAEGPLSSITQWPSIPEPFDLPQREFDRYQSASESKDESPGDGSGSSIQNQDSNADSNDNHDASDSSPAYQTLQAANEQARQRYNQAVGQITADYANSIADLESDFAQAQADANAIGLNGEQGNASQQNGTEGENGTGDENGTDEESSTGEQAGESGPEGTEDQSDEGNQGYPAPIDVTDLQQAVDNAWQAYRELVDRETLQIRERLYEIEEELLFPNILSYHEGVELVDYQVYFDRTHDSLNEINDLETQLANLGRDEYQTWTEARAALDTAVSNDRYDRSIAVAEINSAVLVALDVALRAFSRGKIEFQRIRDNALEAAAHAHRNEQFDNEEAYLNSLGQDQDQSDDTGENPTSEDTPTNDSAADESTSENPAPDDSASEDSPSDDSPSGDTPSPGNPQTLEEIIRDINAGYQRQQELANIAAARTRSNADFDFAVKENDIAAARATANINASGIAAEQAASVAYLTEYFKTRKSQAAASITRAKTQSMARFDIDSQYEIDQANVQLQRGLELADIYETANNELFPLYQQFGAFPYSDPDWQAATEPIYNAISESEKELEKRLQGTAEFQSGGEEGSDGGESGGGDGSGEEISTAQAIMNRFTALAALNRSEADAVSNAAKTFTNLNAGWVITYNQAINTDRNAKQQQRDAADLTAEGSFAEAVNGYASTVVGGDQTLVQASAGIEAQHTVAIAQAQGEYRLSGAVDQAEQASSFASSETDNPYAGYDSAVTAAEAERLQNSVTQSVSLITQAAQQRRQYVVAVSAQRAAYTLEIINNSTELSVELVERANQRDTELREVKDDFFASASNAIVTHDQSATANALTHQAGKNDAGYNRAGEQLEALLDRKYAQLDGQSSTAHDEYAEELLVTGDTFFTSTVDTEKNYLNGITSAKQALAGSLAEAVKTREDDEADANASFATDAITAGSQDAVATTDRAETMLVSLTNLQGDFELAMLSFSADTISALAAADQEYQTAVANADADLAIAKADANVDAVEEALAGDSSDDHSSGNESPSDNSSESDSPTANSSTADPDATASSSGDTESSSDTDADDSSPEDDFHRGQAAIDAAWTHSTAPTRAGYESAVAASSYDYLSNLVGDSSTASAEQIAAARQQSLDKIAAASVFQRSAIDATLQASLQTVDIGTDLVKEISRASQTFANTLAPVLASNRTTAVANSEAYETAIKPVYRSHFSGDLETSIIDALQGPRDELAAAEATRKSGLATGIAGVINAWGGTYTTALKNYANELADADATRIGGLSEALKTWSIANNAADAAYTIAVGDAQTTLATNAANAAAEFTNAANNHWFSAKEDYATADQAHAIAAATNTIDFVIGQAAHDAGIETPDLSGPSETSNDPPSDPTSLTTTYGNDSGGDPPAPGNDDDSQSPIDEQPSPGDDPAVDFEQAVANARVDYFLALRDPLIAAAGFFGANAAARDIAEAFASVQLDNDVASAVTTATSSLASQEAAINAAGAAAIQALGDAAAGSLHTHITGTTAASVQQVRANATAIAAVDVSFLTAETTRYVSQQSGNDNTAQQTAYQAALTNTSHTLATAQITSKAALATTIAPLDATYSKDLADAILTAETTLANLSAGLAAAQINASLGAEQASVAAVLAHDLATIAAAEQHAISDAHVEANFLLARYSAAADIYQTFADTDYPGASSADAVDYQIAIALGNLTWATVIGAHYVAHRGSTVAAQSTAARQDTLAWSGAAGGAASASAAAQLAIAATTASDRIGRAAAAAAGQTDLAGATSDHKIAITAAGKTRDIALRTIARDTELAGDDADPQQEEEDIEAVAATYATAASVAKNTYGNRVWDANAAYRGAIAQIAGSTTVDHADQFRDYDLAIVDLIAAQDTAFANNDATARLATAQSDLLWKTAQVDARIAAAETAAAAFPSPQTQTPLDNLLDSQPELIEQFEQFYESIQDQVDGTLQETLEGIDLEQSDAITDIGSVHEDETALADGIEPQADTRITPVQPPQATSVRDATGSVFSSRKVRETVVAELPSAHDYGGLIGETGLPGIASTSYVNVHQIHDNGGGSLSFEDTFGGFAAGSIAQGAGAIIGVPQSETRTYTYTVGQSPNEETPAEDGETQASDAGTYELSDSGSQFNNILAREVSDGPNPTAAEDGDAQETDTSTTTTSNVDSLETGKLSRSPIPSDEAMEEMRRRLGQNRAMGGIALAAHGNGVPAGSYGAAERRARSEFIFNAFQSEKGYAKSDPLMFASLAASALHENEWYSWELSQKFRDEAVRLRRLEGDSGFAASYWVDERIVEVGRNISGNGLNIGTEGRRAAGFGSAEGPLVAATIISSGRYRAPKGGALIPVGKYLNTVDDVLANPQLLAGKTPAQVQAILGKTSGWSIETLGKGSRKGQGWVLREYNAAGNPTGRMLRWHPGGGHHGPNPYWRVNGHEIKSGIIPGGSM